MMRLTEDVYIRHTPSDNVLAELKKDLALRRGKRRTQTKSK